MNNPPKWNPVRSRVRLQGKFVDYKYLRNSSNAYISKPEVRGFLFKETGAKCTKCDSPDRLEIHHIRSVYFYFKTNDKHRILAELNSKKNLQVLCKLCHGKMVD